VPLNPTRGKALILNTAKRTKKQAGGSFASVEFEDGRGFVIPPPPPKHKGKRPTH
jgi:hypothetical protein